MRIAQFAVGLSITCALGACAPVEDSNIARPGELSAATPQDQTDLDAVFAAARLRGDRAQSASEWLSRSAARFESAAPRPATQGASEGQAVQAITTTAIPFTAATFGQGVVTKDVEADSVVVFAAQPSPTAGGAPRIFGYTQLGGIPFEVAMPAGSPLNVPLRIVSVSSQRTGLFRTQGTLLLLDAVIQPAQLFDPLATSSFRVYEVSYSWSPANLVTPLALSVTNTYTIARNSNPPTMPPNGMVYPSGLTRLRDGSIAVGDEAGQLFVKKANEPVFLPRFANPFYGFGLNGPLSVRGRYWNGSANVVGDVSFLPPGPAPGVGFFPGHHDVQSVRGATASQDRVCLVVGCGSNYSPTFELIPGCGPATGISCVSADALLDDSISPLAKPIAPVLAGPGSEYIDGVAVVGQNLYYARGPADAGNVGCAYGNSIRRINLGAASPTSELLYCDTSSFTRFNWTSGLAARQVLPGVTVVYAGQGQEINSLAVNSLLTADRFTSQTELGGLIVLN
jgi:hypothetical protein